MKERQGPSFTTDHRGRMIWRRQGNTIEQDLQIGIGNVQAYFLARYPEFDELFPRGDDGFVAPDKREEASQFIEERMFEPHSYPASIRGKNAPYFSGGTVGRFRTCFEPWGLTISEQGYSPPREITLSDFFGDTSSQAVWRREGARDIVDFLDSGLPFSEIRPSFFPNDSVKESSLFISKNKNGGYRVYFGLGNDMRDVLGDSDLLVFPFEEPEVGRYWLLLYKLGKDGSVTSSDRMTSVSIDLANKDLENYGRDGVALRRLHDYLEGSPQRHPGDLLPFSRTARKYEGVNFGKLNNSLLITSLRGNNIQPGERIDFFPRFDDRLGYTWLEGYVQNDDNSQRLVFDRRIVKGSDQFYKWKGPELQSIGDFIRGAISNEVLRPVTVQIERENQSISIPTPNDESTTISFWGLPSLHAGDLITFTPYADDLYEWIDITKVADNSLIRSALIRRSAERSILDHDWRGPLAQRFEDVIRGKIPFEALRPIVVVPKSDGEIRLSPTLRFYSKGFANQSIELDPVLGENGEYLLHLRYSTDPTPLLTYVLDCENQRIVRKRDIQSQKHEVSNVEDPDEYFDSFVGGKKMASNERFTGERRVVTTRPEVQPLLAFMAGNGVIDGKSVTTQLGFNSVRNNLIL